MLASSLWRIAMYVDADRQADAFDDEDDSGERLEAQLDSDAAAAQRDPVAA